MIKWFLLDKKMGRLLQKIIHSTMKKQVKEHVLSNIFLKKGKKKGFPRLWVSRTRWSRKSQFVSVTKAERRFVDSPAQRIAVPLPIPSTSSGV